MSMTETSSFPKMGDEGYAGLMNMSGDRSAYTTPVARKGPTTPDQGGGNAGGRSNGGMLHEGMGAGFRPVASRVYAPEYPATGRNIRTVPSAANRSDFWTARGTNGSGYDV
jgi:hypothetical protein